MRAKWLGGLGGKVGVEGGSGWVGDWWGMVRDIVKEETVHSKKRGGWSEKRSEELSMNNRNNQTEQIIFCNQPTNQKSPVQLNTPTTPFILLITHSQNLNLALVSKARAALRWYPQPAAHCRRMEIGEIEIPRIGWSRMD